MRKRLSTFLRRASFHTAILMQTTRVGSFFGSLPSLLFMGFLQHVLVFVQLVLNYFMDR